MAYVKASERRGQLVRAARAVLLREGVGGATLRVIATEADVPLGTLHYVFPSKNDLLRAVMEEVMEEIAGVLDDVAQVGSGLEHFLRNGLDKYWIREVVGNPELQLVQQELTSYALRTPGLESLARWQHDRYSRIVAARAQEAAATAGEICAVPFDTLSRVVVATVLGLIQQFLADPDEARSARDVLATADMIVKLADPRPARADG
ncbi:TetR/AcrR family transcriptional regulator [Angustibacter sp. McL0619]|uniref:TetR/AcrR family transcriptional regulator n=1 Tax=Angustibacter sp. McL0619 TaxID=3415676 RepID=UPI003CECECED